MSPASKASLSCIVQQANMELPYFKVDLKKKAGRPALHIIYLNSLGNSPYPRMRLWRNRKLNQRPPIRRSSLL